MFGKDGDTLYFAPINFNLARVLNEVRSKAIESGAKIVKDYNKHGTLVETVSDWKERDVEKRNTVEVDCITYFSFVLDNIKYYVEFDRNPFFEFHYSKAKVDENGKYSRNYYIDEMSKEWMFDELFKRNCPHEIIRESAEMLFTYLVNAEMSKKYAEYETVHVPNTYDGSWHWEKKRKPERFGKVEYIGEEVN